MENYTIDYHTNPNTYSHQASETHCETLEKSSSATLLCTLQWFGKQTSNATRESVTLKCTIQLKIIIDQILRHVVDSNIRTNFSIPLRKPFSSFRLAIVRSVIKSESAESMVMPDDRVEVTRDAEEATALRPLLKLSKAFSDSGSKFCSITKSSDIRLENVILTVSKTFHIRIQTHTRVYTSGHGCMSLSS